MSAIDRAFSIHDDALMLRSRRTSILAANSANADTPNYKARDMDFPAMMQKITKRDQHSITLAKTNDRHISNGMQQAEAEIKYRNPFHPSLDGNTVDMHREQARFSENAVAYQTSLTFLSSKVRGLMLAIKGQQ